MSNKPKIYLLDASSYIHRAFHAVRGLSTSDGVPTGAVYGFVQMLLKVLKDADPEYLAVVYDAKGPTFRHEMYPAYKANRPPLDPTLKAQFPLVRQVVTAFDLPGVEMEGYEADDLMATLCRLAVEKDFEVVLVSGDKDLFQLLSDRVTMWDTMKNKRLGPAEVKEKLGLGPEMMIDFQALTGDSTDNIPGIPGVGPKTAVKLLLEHGSLEKVLEGAADMKKSKMRENLLQHKDLAWLSRDLVSLAQDAPLGFEPEDYKVRKPDPQVLTPVLAKLEFNRLINEFATPAQEVETDYRMVLDPSELDGLIARAGEIGCLALDTETTSVEAMRARLVGISLSAEPGKAVYIPLGHNLHLGEKQADQKAVFDYLKPVFADESLAKVGQNIKYDLTVLERAGLSVKGVSFDTMLASYLLAPGRTAHNLTAIAAENLGRSMISFEEAVGGKNKSFADAPLEKATQYAAEDADVTFQAFKVLEPKLKQSSMEELFYELEMPLVEVLTRMEMNGVGLDVKGLADLDKELTSQLDAIEERCYTLAGHKFNLNSPKQLGVVLFEELGLRQIKKTKKKTGYSTDMSVLTQLAEDHELPAELLNYRTLSKLKSTYVEALPKLVHPETKRLHTSFNQAVTATGRLSSSNPNLQNIPVRTQLGERIRQCFVPEAGKVLVAADYSQIELRVLAHLSKDELLTQDLSQGLDVHTQTAARLFEIPAEEVTGDQRRRAKTVNFGVLYGMSAFRLAREQKISRGEAQDIIDRYLGRYAGIAAFTQDNLTYARENGYVTTLLGRRRYLPAINSTDRLARQSAERMALNTPIQGTAADIIKKAMIKCHEMLVNEFPETMMILQVHDELVFETPEKDRERLSERVQDIMQNIIELSVPLDVDLGWGDNWAQAH
ncbi:DNA polymerase I [Dethiosulfatarculus sandiegensis]|uniref:DNA polymerase I n=1 Tax=Dethiosulfatarculus sandiegensis TaxID=1429043 RepID=A0A0D2HZW5_9BACT|nr:DNA polymerase I [Dethiosulfatarculus sandiegensis]KIX15833.1 DNA polymerase I [Dethiosulfatarculus sandiegensis]